LVKKAKYYYGLIQLFIGGIITILVESASSGELLFTDGFLADSLRGKILDNVIYLIIVLLSINILAYFYYLRAMEKGEMQGVFNNICKAIFVSHIKNNDKINNIKVRVTLFKAYKGFKCIGKFYSPKHTIYLKQVGRYQVVQDKKNCKIHYLPDEGCVGICYNTAQALYKEIPEYTNSEKENYTINNMTTFNLSEGKVKKINVKSCSFLAFPVNYFDSDDVFGVLIFDSMEKNKMKILKTRALEDKILNYSAFFNNKSI